MEAKGGTRMAAFNKAFGTAFSVSALRLRFQFAGRTVREESKTFPECSKLNGSSGRVLLALLYSIPTQERVTNVEDLVLPPVPRNGVSATSGHPQTARFAAHFCFSLWRSFGGIR